jgi:Bacterial cell division membrane protein
VNGVHPDGSYLLLLFPVVYAGLIYTQRYKNYLGILESFLYLVPVALLGTYITVSGTVLCLTACILLLTAAILKSDFYKNKILAIGFICLFTTLFALLLIKNSLYYDITRLIDNVFPRGEKGYSLQLISGLISNAEWIGHSDNNDLLYTNSTIFLDKHLLTYMIDKYGWISFGILMLFFLTFIIRGFILYLKQRNTLGRLLLSAVLMTYTIEVISYMGNNLGLYRPLPFELPFVSYGGEVTVINMLLMGIMLSVIKSSDVVRDNLKTAGRRKIVTVSGRKIIIDFSKS